MTEDAFIILEPTTKPKPSVQPKPLIVAPTGRTMADLSPAQKSRAYRRQDGPFYMEPVYNEAGPTGSWRIGVSVAADERIISDDLEETEAIEWLRTSVREFYGGG